MSESYYERIQSIKLKYPRAYELWSKEDEKMLADMYLAGNSAEEMSHVLQRQPSAIRSRLAKGNHVTSALAKEDTNSALAISFSLQWSPVLREVDRAYFFPQPITLFMTNRYKWPAVYQWSIHQPIVDAPCLLYIGSTKKLCPDRLRGYLEPENSNTNSRLNSLFHEYLREEYQIRLEILKNCRISIGDSVQTSYHFRSQSRRLVLEELLIEYYKQQGIELLNK